MTTIDLATAAIPRRTPGQAVAELTRALSAARERGRLGAAIELHILRCLAHVRRGDPGEALADLERALALGEPEGYARIFLDEGQPVQMLLAQWLAHANPGPLRDYAVHLVSQFDAEPQAAAAQQPAPAARPQQALIEPLSRRELEVLRLIALGKTNPEIARQLVVAPGTVKAHAAHIYTKLDVSNRTQAVARARQLGLLP